jgi:acetyltransferase-like isoleucine patch superfamily enzyme
MQAKLKDFIRPMWRSFWLHFFHFSSIGKNVYVHPAVKVSGAQNIVIGNEVHIHRGSNLLASQSGQITLMDGCRIGPSASLHSEIGFIRIGQYGYIGPQTILRGDGGLLIGNHALISPQVVIMSANHIITDPSIPIRLQGETHQGITIGDDVWIGAGAKILDGVIIGNGAVIGAGAVVSRNIPELAIAVGVPARVIKYRGEEKS